MVLNRGGGGGHLSEGVKNEYYMYWENIVCSCWSTYHIYSW